MKSTRHPSPATAPDAQATAARVTWQGAVLISMSISSAFLVVIAGFAVAMTLILTG